jgi:hypothetical protein
LKDRRFFYSVISLIGLVTLVGCSSNQGGPVPTEGQARVDFELLHTLPDEPISFDEEVRPVL